MPSACPPAWSGSAGRTPGALPRRMNPLAYVLNLKLADPAAAPAFVDEHNPPENAPPGTRASDAATPLLQSWQEIHDQTATLVRNQRRALLTGGWLLVLLALASVAVLVGGRMADQIRRVGLLKAVGGTPSLVAAVLLAEYVVVALLAAGGGARGRLAGRPTAHRSHCRPPRRRGCAAARHLHGRPGDGRRARGRGRRDLRSCRARRPYQHRPRAGRLGPRTPAHGLADRGLGATARPAAARAARRRPATAPRRARHGQHRDHRQRDRRRAGRPRRPRRRVLRDGPNSDRPAQPGAAGDHDHARHPRGRQRDLHHLGDAHSTPDTHRRSRAHSARPHSRSARDSQPHRCFPRSPAPSSASRGASG